MIEHLAAYSNSLDPETNLYVNGRRAELRRQQLATLKPGSGAALNAQMEMGYELMLDGQCEAALITFDEVRAGLLEKQRRLEQLRDAPPEAGRALERLLGDVRRMRALAALRLGEQENCIDHHGIDACLVPIRDTGLHSVRRGSELALEELTAALEADPDDFESRWLYNLAAMTLGRYPNEVPDAWRIPPSAFASGQEFPRFLDVAVPTGTAIHGLAGGVCTEDFDGDGLIDILASSWGLDDPLVLLTASPDGTYLDRAGPAGLDGITGGLNMTHADYDNDGDSDVLVLRGAWFEKAGRVPNSLLRNEGDGTFSDVTEQAGLLSFHPTQTAAWVDFDNDGWLDLFIGNEAGPFESHPCELFRNNGDGTFTECATAAGLGHRAYVKAAIPGDFDNDGLTDLYLSSVNSPNVLFRNLGDWRFEDVTERAGVAEPRRSFPGWFFDYDNDGWLDLFVSGYRWGSTGFVCQDYLGLEHRGWPPRLYRNRGDGTFEDVTGAAGLDTVLNTMGTNYGDLDNDGWLDLYLATGEPDFASVYPNRMFRNDAGRRFVDVTTAGGFGHVQKGHGVAFTDLDNDGDQDIYAVMGGAYSGDVFFNVLFENPGNDHRWLTLRLEGTSSNRSAIGARIAVSVEAPPGQRTIHRVVGTGGSFGSASLQQEIGLGPALRILELRVLWPTTGVTQVFRDVPMDSVLELREGEDLLRPVEPARLRLGGTRR
jgi:hypothetical protein